MFIRPTVCIFLLASGVSMIVSPACKTDLECSALSPPM
jgi:hypothetical protein